MTEGFDPEQAPTTEVAGPPMAKRPKPGQYEIGGVDEAGLAIETQVPDLRPAVKGSPRTPPTVVQVEAAKLRLITDSRLGKESPEWLRRVANGLPAEPAPASR